MATCPSCGATDRHLVKSWSMIGKPSKSGEIFKLTMGLYECENCCKSFRSVVDKEKISLKDILDRNNLLEENLMEATKKRTELEERVQALENERACLVTEIEALRIIPELEEKASTLESDVKRLRKEKESLLARIKELMTEKTSPVKDMSLEAFLSENRPVEDNLPEDVAAITESVPREADVATPETPYIESENSEVSTEECSPEPDEEAPAISPVESVVEEPAGPVADGKPVVEVPQWEPEPVSAEPKSKELSLSPDEAAPVEFNSTLGESTTVMPAELPPALDEVSTQVLETVLPTITSEVELMVEEKPDVTSVEEAVPRQNFEGQSKEADETGKPPVELAPLEVKSEEQTPVASTQIEAPSTESPPVNPIVEINASIQNIADTVVAEAIPTPETPVPTEQSIETPKNVDPTTNYSKEDTSSIDGSPSNSTSVEETSSAVIQSKDVVSENVNTVEFDTAPANSDSTENSAKKETDDMVQD